MFRRLDFGSAFAAALVLAGGALAQPAVPPEQPLPESTADHAKFDELDGPFASGPEVTQACLACHTEAGEQFMHSIHWTWRFAHPETGQVIGKRNIINSFCGSIVANEPRCTSCHAGYGWEDEESFDFTDQTAMDCLVCHDTTGTYVKAPAGAGRPVLDEPIVHYGETLEPVDLAHVAQNVGATSAETCGSCHFYGGGGDNVKHGDLSSALVDPPLALDVHMAADGADLGCTDCHVGSAHRWAGSRYAVEARDPVGTGLPGERRDVATCESCHGLRPHPEPTVTHLELNDHVARVACQTCHVPAFARGGHATKMYWDWSEAGRLNDEGEPYVETDADGHAVYKTKLGAFRWGEDVVPTYRWFDGQIRYTLVDDEIDPAGVVPINRFDGAASDPASRIWPFKAMGAKQPFDSWNQNLVYNQLFEPGSDAAFWETFDFDRSIQAAMAEADAGFSGEYDFVETVMWWPITHMVPPAAQSVTCEECHTRDGRMADIAGVYIPGRDGDRRVDLVGYLAVGAALAGVGLHAAGRWISARRRAS
jgi:octaheme c-type cytochrome (tetrathionate reductase family)